MMESKGTCRELVLATHNPAKADLYGRAFARFGWKAVSFLPATRQQGEENGPTPEANALQKAEAAWRPGLTVFADDAGMEVDALGGEPGVQTRRWNGRFADSISDQEWLDYLLARLEGVPSASAPPGLSPAGHWSTQGGKLVRVDWLRLS